ncbi:l-ascorbate oxidase [Moniliophthora roreri]|nr:l-ascorbate oxidase [Moniliophthora roreri]
MATHNVEDGTGGLDASIRFELDRPENIGIGMRSSINDFRSHTRPFASMADIIAMGAVFAYPSCGGPLIPFRAGRIDATSAGVPGVPEPHQDLNSHIASFKRQGFTQTEMIQLVACGHAVGGVRKEDFPEVTNDTFALFHGEQTYDNTVVTGYLDSTTPNPLVVSNNVIVRSDLRIFESDGNVTMEGQALASLASQNAFDGTCAILIERMINTVPKNVTLTEVVQPIENKIGKTRLFLSNDTDSLTLTTSLRLLNPTPNPNRTVTLFWTDSDDSTSPVCPISGCSAQPFDSFSIGDRGGFLGGNGFALHGMDAMKFEFEASVNSTTSISNYWFEIDENDGVSEKVVVDGMTSAYPILHDKILFDPIRSYTTFENRSTVRFITIAVRSEFHPTRLYLETFDPNQSGRDLELPVTEAIDVPLDTGIPPKAGYTFYTAKMVGSVVSFDIHAELGGENLSQDFIEFDEIKTLVFPPN